VVIDVFKVVWLMLAPNDEWASWRAIQKAWLAVAREREIEIDDDREDTWPVMNRSLGTSKGVALSLDGVSLEAEDPLPLPSLVCEVASGELRSSFDIETRFDTGDATFDAELEARTNDSVGARALLHEELRAALSAFAPPVFFRYANGKVKFASGSTTLSTDHLSAVLTVVLAACKHPTTPYR
jgi:hypothetical protein